MKPKIRFVFSLAGLLFCLNTQFVEAITTDPISTYPYAQLSNIYPVAGEKLTLIWWLGVYPNGCVPQYKTTVTKSISSKTIIYNLSYQELKTSDVNMACTQVLTPYGPKFDLGAVESSGYMQLIYIDSVLVKQFKVLPGKYPYAVISPRSPQIGDRLSVQWVLGEDSVNCVPQYSGVVISETLLKSNPPVHMIKVEYEEKPVQYIACVPQTTTYGPVFELGIAEEGEYQIYSGSSLVSRFSVISDEPMKPVMNTYPFLPMEGDSLLLKLTVGYGSSSCSPTFTMNIDSSSENDGLFVYKLSFIEKDNSKDVCTADISPYGPQWIFTGIKAGTYLFYYTEHDYYKIYVQPRRQVPDFPYLTIKGTVFDRSKSAGSSGFIGNMVAPQCTVALVKYQKLYPLSIQPAPSLVAVDTNAQNSSVKYMAVTDEFGNYTIANIPVSVVLNRVNVVALKGGMIGYGAIPVFLSNEITSDITLYNGETANDSLNQYPGKEDVIRLFETLATSGTAGVFKTTSGLSQKPGIIPTDHGFKFCNPSKQKVNISLYSMDGKIVWSKPVAQLNAGTYFYALPALSSGVFVIRVAAGNYFESRVITVNRR